MVLSKIAKNTFLQSHQKSIKRTLINVQYFSKKYIKSMLFHQAKKSNENKDNKI